jgi:predicted nucleic acid-binding protein
MILVDTSVWVRHLRAGDSRLREYLEAGLVLIHPMILGEISCGNLRNRERTLAELAWLPVVSEATHDEATALLERKRLFGLGVGWVDIHLIASSLITDCSLLTYDVPLQRAASKARVRLAGPQ